MTIFKNTLVGSGMSALVYDLYNKKRFKIFSSPRSKILKSNNFYELDKLGGNSNIWGGYINLRRHKKFLANSNYQKLFNNKIFKINQIFTKDSLFFNTFSLVDKNGDIFRVKKKFFKNNISLKRIDKIIYKKNKLKILIHKKIITTKKLILCIGNLNLIKLLYKSNIIKSDDFISYDDSKCSYVLNNQINQKKNYYIPMPFLKILEKIIFKKSKSYDLLNTSLILQKFSGKVQKHKIQCKYLIKMKDTKLRFFLSNHVTNLRINNVPIRKFLHNKTKNIDVFCSGALKNYLPGPIIQDLIFDIVKK